MMVEIRIATVGIISASRRYSGYDLFSMGNGRVTLGMTYLADTVVSLAQPFRRQIAQPTAQKWHSDRGSNLTCENIAKSVVTP